MPSFSKKSAAKLATCHPDIQRVMHEAIKVTDFTVLTGERGRQAQDEAFKSGRSKVRYPGSKHNRSPSLAVDIAPWPVDWTDLDSFDELAEVVLGIADRLGVEMRWGGNFDGWYDGPHYELR